jgi:hypothetical protein
MLVLTGAFATNGFLSCSVFASSSIDFVIEWLEPTRAQYLVGEVVNIGVGIRNTGTEEIEAYHLEASLVLVFPDGQKIFVGQDWNGFDIPQGNIDFFDFEWIVPSTAKGGWYGCEVSIIHKPTSLSKQMTKSNLFQVIASPPDVDLVGEIHINGIKYAHMDTAYISGTNLNIKFAVINIGSRPAQSFHVRYRLLLDTEYKEEKVYSSLSVGSTVTFEKTFTNLNLKTGGGYLAHMTIDFLGEVAEKNETNNDYAVFIKVGKQASTFQITLLQSTITYGSHIIIEGSISPIPQSSFYTDVYYTRPDGTSVKHQTNHQGNRSSFAVDYYVPDMLGTWSVYAVWYGNSELEGATSNTLTFQVTSEGFTLATHPVMIGLYQGQQGQVTVNVESASPQPYSIALTVHGLPSYTNYYFNTSSGNPPFSARLTIETSANTPPGEYAITIKGAGGGYENQVTFTLNIYPASEPSGELYSIPAKALIPPGDSLIDRALLTSASPGQTIVARPGETVYLTVGYQIWQGSNPYEIDQMFFIYSWSPSWPPPEGYYAEIYNGIPPSYPGVTGTKQVEITVPTVEGTYYLWVGWCAHYSVPEAVQGFTNKPPLPAHVKIVVQTATPSLAPSLNSPVNGVSLSSLTVTFSWSPVPEATRYELYISGPQSYNIDDISGTSYSVDLTSPGAYTWKVRGYNSAGYGPWSSSWSFTIQAADSVAPSVRVLAPNGGESLSVGSTFRIRWEATDNVGVSYVTIWLFQGTNQVTVIASNYPNTGYYDWTVPNRVGEGYKVRIAAVDAAGNAGYDDTDSTVTITTATSKIYVLHVQSYPITGIQIPYSGDFSGTGVTDFYVGPTNSPFAVILTAPLNYQVHRFKHWELDGVSMGESCSLTVEVNDENRQRTAIAVYSTETVFPEFDWEKTLERFKAYKEMYQIFLERYLNSGWWHELALERAEAAKDYDLFKEFVNNFVDTWTDYFEVITELPISPIKNMLAMKDLSEGLIRAYNLFLYDYLEAVSNILLHSAAHLMFWLDLCELLDKIDGVITALHKRDYNDFTYSLKNLRQALEEIFVSSREFDAEFYLDVLKAEWTGYPSPTIGVFPLTTKANIYGAIRHHLINFRELLSLSYIDVTHLLGKAECLSEKKPEGILISRPNKPVIKEAYWEVDGNRVTEAPKDKEVTVHVILRTANISSFEYDKVEGNITVVLKKDVAWWWDSIAGKSYAQVSDKILKPGQTIDLTLTFTPDEATSLTLRGYYIEVIFSGEYLYWDNKLSDIPVQWDDGSRGTMKNSYPPRLKVSGESQSSGTIVVLTETQHRLYLHIYDENSRHVGLNYETGIVETQIPDCMYYDFNNGTAIVLPLNLTNFKVVVDAKYAHEINESYELSVIATKEYEVIDQKSVTGKILKGAKQLYNIQISPESEAPIIQNEEANVPWWIQHQIWIIAGVIGAIALLTVSVTLVKKRKRHNLGSRAHKC